MRKRILKLLIVVYVIFASLILFRNREILNEFNQKHTMKEQPSRKDWHDLHAMHIDSQRVGLGEHGEAATLGNNIDRALEARLFKQHGLNALLSDAISVNRSVPDARVKGCLHKKYLRKLPTVSIVISFYNELLSTFARTLHSLINRTPPELLKEIILVDDFSDLEFFQKLEKYVTAHFTKVRFVRLPRRMGLIRGRMAGIRNMTAEVLVILDAHIEVGYNWLPPLLEPIALNKSTLVSPIVDVIEAKDLAYVAVQPKQGGFSWTLLYITTPISQKDLRDSTEPYNNPVMLGCCFAMSRDYFWELGGYDEGLQIWGGEQFELSFKVWMCGGGQLLNVPCSRVAHHYRGNLEKGLNAKDPDYLIKNKIRVVKVWLDDYKKYFYERHSNKIQRMYVGDLTKQIALREKLHCKTFDWYMNEIAVNVLNYYPPVQPTHYAAGAIQSARLPYLCIDIRYWSFKPALHKCSRNLQKPNDRQIFLLRWNQDLQWGDSDQCLDVPDLHDNAPVILYSCHNNGGTQFWYYDRSNKWLVHRPYGVYCLEIYPPDMSLVVNICDKKNLNMKWNFGMINETALDRFYEKIRS